MSLPPGPRAPGIISLLQWMAGPVEAFESSFRRYGDIYSVKNPLLGTEIIISHPEMIRTVLAGDPEVFLAGEANKPLSPVIGERSVLVLDGREHHRERKLLMPPFHGERLGTYADTMRSITERVVAGWPAGKRFSVLPSMQRITMDVILETVLGVHDGAEIDALRDCLVAFVEKAQSPLGMVWMLPVFQRDLGPLTGWASLQRTLREVDERVYGVIARARATPPEARGDDVLSLLLAAVDEEGHGMTDQELRDELMTLLLAGHETTATALSWAVEEIHRRPEVLAKILDEVLSVPKADRHRAQLPYLDAAIKEVLRLRPLAPLLARKVTAPVTLGAYEIPAGVYAVPCVYLAQRHPDFWEAPSEFRAERFIGKKIDPYAWLPFGGGARRCIGMAFALFEMRAVLATILPEVKLRLTDPPAKVKLRSFLFAPSAGTRVAIESRATA